MRKPIELDEQEYCLLVKRRDGPLYTSEQLFHEIPDPGSPVLVIVEYQYQK